MDSIMNQRDAELFCSALNDANQPHELRALAKLFLVTDVMHANKRSVTYETPKA